MIYTHKENEEDSEQKQEESKEERARKRKVIVTAVWRARVLPRTGPEQMGKRIRRVTVCDKLYWNWFNKIGCWGHRRSRAVQAIWFTATHSMLCMPDGEYQSSVWHSRHVTLEITIRYFTHTHMHRNSYMHAYMEKYRLPAVLPVQFVQVKRALIIGG